jgi:two-component system, NarL family, sensor kinase
MHEIVTARPRRANRVSSWLTESLVGLVLIAWAATIYMAVLVADGFSDQNSQIDWWAHAIALILVAITIVPVRRWLKPPIEDLIYGFDDAYSLMERFNQQIDVVQLTTADQKDPSLAATIGTALNLPYVSITADDIEISVIGSKPADRTLTELALTYQGSVVGNLIVAPRRPASQLTTRDHQLLKGMAQQLSVALFAMRTSQQLQASRLALVEAREEERRRIRRDLHDGLGPTLASMRLQLAAMARLLDDQPERAREVLTDVRNGINGTTSEIRRLVYGLRPPLIDELGLIAAIRNHPSVGAGFVVQVNPDELPPLPAATEVALYRIALEAIHNAQRHSRSKRCEVTIDVVGNQVTMTVEDHGTGLPESSVEGVGIAAMRERATELGGTLELETEDGTTVRTVMPLQSSLDARND